MANGQCDICGKPATVRAQVVSNGERRQMELCDEHYRQIARQSRGRSASPLESLFGGSGSLFEDFFGDSLFSDRDVPSPDSGEDGRAPVRRGGRRGSRGLAERVSEQAEKLLQEAARKAADLGRREVDTEHLLYALTDSDVCLLYTSDAADD